MERNDLVSWKIGQVFFYSSFFKMCFLSGHSPQGDSAGLEFEWQTLNLLAGSVGKVMGLNGHNLHATSTWKRTVDVYSRYVFRAWSLFRGEDEPVFLSICLICFFELDMQEVSVETDHDRNKNCHATTRVTIYWINERLWSKWDTLKEESCHLGT